MSRDRFFRLAQRCPGCCGYTLFFSGVKPPRLTGGTVSQTCQKHNRNKVTKKCLGYFALPLSQKNKTKNDNEPQRDSLESLRAALKSSD